MSEQVGFIYRIPGLDAAGVRELIERYVERGSVFGGNIIKFDALRNFTTANELAQNLVDWDFGYAFSAAVEIRWRRVVPFDSDQPDSFDTLLLADQPISGLSGGEEISGPWRLQHSSEDTHIIMTVPSGASLGYVRYIAPNETVQFTRYTEAFL